MWWWVWAIEAKEGIFYPELLWHSRSCLGKLNRQVKQLVSIFSRTLFRVKITWWHLGVGSLPTPRCPHSKVFLVFRESLQCSILCHCLWSWPWAAPKRPWLQTHWTLPLDVHTRRWVPPPSLLFKRRWLLESCESFLELLPFSSQLWETPLLCVLKVRKSNSTFLTEASYD